MLFVICIFTLPVAKRGVIKGCVGPVGWLYDLEKTGVRSRP